MVQREEGEQVDRSLEDVEPIAGPGEVEAVPCVTARNVQLESGSGTVDAPFMSVAGCTMHILSDEYGIVIFPVAALRPLAAFVDQAGMNEGVQHVPADMTLLEQVGVDPAHGAVPRRKNEFLFLLLLRRCGPDLALFTVQEAGHGLRVAQAIELLDKRYRPAALFRGMVVPLVSTDGDAVVACEAAFPAFPQELFSLAEKKGFQVYGGGALLLGIGKFNIRHDSTPYKNVERVIRDNAFQMW